MDKETKEFLASAVVAASLLICSVLAFTTRHDGRKLLEFTPNFTPEAYLEAMAVGDHLDPVTKSRMADALTYIADEFGPDAIVDIEQGVRSAVAFREKGAAKPSVLGFEKLGVSNAELAELWSEEYYPRQWIEHNVQTIAFRNFSPKLRSSYGIDGYTVGEVEDFTHRIDLFKRRPPSSDFDELKYTRVNLDWTFSHELGHLNDWVNASYLSREDRIEFLVEVSRAFHHVRAFKSADGYVDSIKNSDYRKQNYYRTAEWWAMLCEYYFTFPNILIRENDEDFYLVYSRVHDRDPEFSTLETYRERAAKLKSIIEE